MDTDVFNSIPWTWILWATLVFFAIRTLARLALQERDTLQEKLMEKLRAHFEEVKRQRKIKKMREKLRRLREKVKAQAAADLQAATQTMAAAKQARAQSEAEAQQKKAA